MSPRRRPEVSGRGGAVVCRLQLWRRRQGALSAPQRLSRRSRTVPPPPPQPPPRAPLTARVGGWCRCSQVPSGHHSLPTSRCNPAPSFARQWASSCPAARCSRRVWLLPAGSSLPRGAEVALPASHAQVTLLHGVVSWRLVLRPRGLWAPQTWSVHVFLSVLSVRSVNRYSGSTCSGQCLCSDKYMVFRLLRISQG